jgi:hypothetical protein
MRITALIVTLGLAAVACLGARAAQSGAPQTVSCDSIIGQADSGHAAGNRVVLGVVSVPPAYGPQVVPTRSRPWAFWRKAGLVIRSGSRLVSVSVPKAWRKRAAITWGNSGIVNALRFSPCPRLGAKPWNAYAGGFYLRARAACLPLVFRVGQRSATVRFGLGRRCGAN